MARSMKEVHTINYYPINEGAARRAKEMNSFSDYKEGSATAEYRAMVDKAAAIAEQQKSRVDPMYHEKIDHLLDTYARKQAENMNQGFAIDARVPSVMIAGPANFPVGKKEKQNRARDSNMEEWRYIQGLLDKIRSTGMGGISADDPAALNCVATLVEIADSVITGAIDRAEFKACLNGLTRAIGSDDYDGIISAFLGVKYAVAYFFRSSRSVLEIYKKLEYDIKHLAD